MKKRSLMNFCKNAVGTVFLLVGAFFVCSTLLSMRAVLADPIAPTPDAPVGQNNTSGRATARTNPRGNMTARPTRQTSVTDARGTDGRNVAARGVVSRQRSTDTNVARTADRGVVSRSINRAKSGTRSVSTRGVRSRNATNNEARVSLSGDAIRGSKSSTGTYYTYASGKLYSGNYSNIIDATTGLISADAYSSCLEAYYTCMDEICTARNEAQRRCACAGRVKSFAAAESALESANEELIQVSGELTLLIANEGKAVSAAFTLTDAEKVMNCASWKEVTQQYGTSSAEAKQWCYAHGIYGTQSSTITYNGSKMTGMFVSDCSKPSYCNKNTNGLDFDADDLNGTSSDILASLAEWADTVKENTDTLLGSNDQALFGAISDWTNETSGLTNISLDDESVQDTLANTWGYQLFEYAHNNVCSRVLDSCFNGIYESCGTPPSGGRCANGATSSCPYNYNSKITVSSSGDVTLNERGTTSSTSSASCFGYTSSSGDPYSSLRGPVADARRSVMQKYLLDANADCDLYGEQLKAAAQKITYQKVAAQQALQKKRLEFYNNDQTKTLNDATVAGTNFNECISELYDCYETQETAHPGWTTARIKTYCAQIDNSPSCYQDMICNPSYAQFKAVIDKADNENCDWHSSDYTKNTCRNVVTLNEILNPVVTGSVSNPTTATKSGNSSVFREACLREALGCGADGKTGCIRSWTATPTE